MKKKIIIGCMLSTFIILMIPSISAIEYNNVVDEYKTNILIEFKSMDFENFINKFNNINKKQLTNDFFMGFKNLINGFNEKLFNDPEQPLFFPILGIVFYGLIAIIILSILFSIFNSIFTVIKLILGAIIGTITGVLGSVWNIVVGAANIVVIILTLIVDVIVAIINGSIGTIANIGKFIVGILVNLYNFISTITNQMWEKYIIILGLILDILKMIYDTIFNPGSILT